MPTPPPVTTNPIAVPWIDDRHHPVQTQSTSTSANPNPQNLLVGVDSATFTALANTVLPKTVTVTFTNLPVRNVQQNPLNSLQSSQNILNVPPNNHLILSVTVQGNPGVAGTVVTAAPLARTVSGVKCPGPFLGNERFLTFQAVVTIAQSPIVQTVRGSIVAHLHLATG